MSESKQKQVVKVVLSTGKIVLLHMMKIGHTEQAAEMVAQRAGGDSSMMQILINKALVQLLLWKVDGKIVTPAQKEDLDSVLGVGEFGQLLKVVAKMSGADEAKKELTPEFVTSGEA